ncbi:MAG: RNA methyltransferase [Oscillospiraceae bacterium]|nr:RNA methyltransferase [Oscillospiraceae bacterium]
MIITSRQNPIIKQFRSCDRDCFVVEGEKLVNEAIEAGFEPVRVLVTQKNIGKLSGVVITDELSEYISDTKTPQGIHVLFRRKAQQYGFHPLRRVIVLDNVQDPGNVGAILRSCEAFGWDCVILFGSGVDVFSGKVIRASAGSVFRVPVYNGDAVSDLKEAGFTIYATVLDEEAQPLNKTVFAEKSAVVIGNEGRGISKEVISLCDKKIYIPIKGAESLNAAVAAGIICYEPGEKLCQS